LCKAELDQSGLLLEEASRTVGGASGR